MRQRLRVLLGERRTTSPFEIAAWMGSLLLLTLAVRTNQVLAADSFFFIAHGTPAWALIVLWVAATAVLVSLLTAVVLVLHKVATPHAYDALTTALTFVVAAFFFGNAWGRLVGILAAAVFTVFARRIVFGKVVLLVAAATAMIPLLSLGPANGSDYAAREIDYVDGQDRPSVLWILPDRAQYQMFFDADGRVRPEFPNLRRLQQTATTYTRAYATANGTEMSLPSMLNGVAEVPVEPEAIEQMQRSPGIVSWLSPVYNVVVDSPVFTDLCASTGCTQSSSGDGSAAKDLAVFAADVVAVAGNTLDPAIAASFPSLDGRWRDFWRSQPAVVQQGSGQQGWRSRFGASPVPQFVLWHTLTTHDPYNRDFDGLPIFGFSPPEDTGSWYDVNGSLPSDMSERLARRLYLAGGVAFDRELGSLLDLLEEQGGLDDTMVILNSDHGRAFSKSGDHRIGDDPTMVWNEVAHVPLLVKSPGQMSPSVVSEPRSTAQIAQSILDAADVTVQGGPALAPELSQPPSEGPFFVVDLGRETPEVEVMPEDLVAADGWTSDDLRSVGSDLPFSLVDTDLENAAVGSEWTTFAPSRIRPVVEGESRFQLVGIEVTDEQCAAGSRALATLEGKPIAQVVWDQTSLAPKKGIRGWVVLPRDTVGDYTFRCEGD